MMIPKCYQAYEGNVVACPICQDRLMWVAPAADEARYRGFGGWLILFVIGLVAVFPLFAAIGIISSFSVLGRFYAYYPGMLAVFMIDLLLDRSNNLGVLCRLLAGAAQAFCRRDGQDVSHRPRRLHWPVDSISIYLYTP